MSSLIEHNGKSDAHTNTNDHTHTISRESPQSTSSLPTMPAQTAPRPKNAHFFSKVYTSIGFTKWYNFILWLIFGGALVGFSLARLEYLNFSKNYCVPGDPTGGGALPGECFYFSRPFYTAGVILHLAGILPAGILAVTQFVPIIRRKWLLVHRVNGYLIITLSISGLVGGFMLIRRTAGGGLDTQTSAGLLGIAFLVALSLAYVNIKKKRIDLHRAWMIRAWVWAGSIITIRVLVIIIALVLPKTGTYYYSQPCEKVAWQLNNDTQTMTLYPECVGYFQGLNPDQHVSVRATMMGATDIIEVTSILNMSFGSAMWLGLAVHAFAAELYLALTPGETRRLRRISEERRREKGQRKQPL